MHLPSVFAFILPGSLLLSSCALEEGAALSRRSVSTKAPIATWSWAKYVDENSPLDYQVKFRNLGNQILSFDYTIADRDGVPHIDRNGPNSGLVPNLYPGAEIAVANPLKRRDVVIVVGKVTYGKKNLADIQKIYPSDATSALGGADITSPLGAGELPARN